MKKIIFFYILIICTLSLGLSSCAKEELDATSVIMDSQKEESPFDRWILENYTKPYNIDLLYRYVDIESDMNYQLVPAEYGRAVKIAKLMKFLCLEAYDELTGGKEFIRSNYPKMIQLIGSAAYRNNGTMLLGTAEGGLKITMYYVNQLELEPEFLNRYYFKTMHHEFLHILNQTKPYTPDFEKISAVDYVGDTWNSAYTTVDAALKKGFISPYASSEASEDFAELLSIYVTTTPQNWAQMLTTAGPAASTINTKFEIVKKYMINSWNIDLDKLRYIIQVRQSKISTMDLSKID